MSPLSITLTFPHAFSTLSLALTHSHTFRLFFCSPFTKWRNHKNKIYYYISHNMHTQRHPICVCVCYTFDFRPIPLSVRVVLIVIEIVSVVSIIFIICSSFVCVSQLMDLFFSHIFLFLVLFFCAHTHTHTHTQHVYCPTYVGNKFRFAAWWNIVSNRKRTPHNQSSARSKSHTKRFRIVYMCTIKCQSDNRSCSYTEW